MNGLQTEKILRHIKADYIGMGRRWHKNDDVIMNTIMQIYYQTDYIDWEECKWLFTNYLDRGVLDFAEAKIKARIRISKLEKENA